MNKPRRISRIKTTKAGKTAKIKRGYIPFYGSPDNTDNPDSTDSTGNIRFPEANILPEYIKKTLKFKESDVLQINIKYPVFSVKSNPAAGKKINAFYNSAVNSFVGYCEKILYKSAAVEYEIFTGLLNSRNTPDKNNYDKYDEYNNYNQYYNSDNYSDYSKFKPFGAVVTFETPCFRRGFLCVYLDINIYSGKGRGNIARKVQIWDLRNGELYSPKRIIKFSKPMKKRICEHIIKTMERQIRNGEQRYINADIPYAYRQNVYKYLSADNLYLADSGYAFFFPQGTIAPHESGIVEFTVPEMVLAGDENEHDGRSEG